MTAGSFCYIGPQGIVHGTTLTLMNAARKYLDTDSLKGRLYVTSGLGGMSGAQAKAAVIAGAVAIVAEVKGDVVTKRHDQGWVSEVAADLDDCVARATAAVAEGRATSIAFHGNVVELWEHLAESDLVVDLGSDQTSCHNPFGGGYYPAGMSVTEADEMMAADPDQFHEAVQASLRRHCAAVNTLTERGDGKAMRFWDYGNSFLLEAGRAGADVMRDDSGKFRSGFQKRCFRLPRHLSPALPRLHARLVQF
jgi:urocanate hydratase